MLHQASRYANPSALTYYIKSSSNVIPFGWQYLRMIGLTDKPSDTSIWELVQASHYPGGLPSHDESITLTRLGHYPMQIKLLGWASTSK